MFSAALSCEGESMQEVAKLSVAAHNAVNATSQFREASFDAAIAVFSVSTNRFNWIARGHLALCLNLSDLHSRDSYGT